MDLIERANGTIIENNLNVLFNLFLVKEGGRLSTLIEIADLDTEHKPMDYLIQLGDYFRNLYIPLKMKLMVYLGDFLRRLID